MASIRFNPLRSPAQAPLEKLPGLKVPGQAPVHMASRVGMGGLHSYMGHFAQPQVLRAGHNTSGHAHFIQKAIKRPGQLHRDLGVPQGQKIPQSKLRAAAKRGGKVGERARFAETLEHMHKK